MGAKVKNVFGLGPVVFKLIFNCNTDLKMKITVKKARENYE